MGHSLIVAGIGPGGKEYILPKALSAIQHAKYLAGGRRALSDFGNDGQEMFPVTGKLSALAEWIRSSLLHDDVVVMVSGDPGYYSLLPWLKENFSDSPIHVIPGISSVQACFALLAEPWQEAEWLSFHGRVPEEAKLAYKPGRKLSFLTDATNNPSRIAEILISRGWPENTPCAAAERISYDDEKLEASTLKDMKDLEGFGESVMVVMG
ncbi:MAG: precorrin-6y C5,15-methyltransferase (decarboxylating) subunit CbiE [Dialister sp.]|nr:precorrin-6y C5,15-methyltransferase (decarboxylating) subunit CbiE [Dialister sp.]